MNKKAVGVVLAVLAVVVVIGAVIFINKDTNNDIGGIKIETVEDLQTAITKIHQNVGDKIPMVDTMEIDVTDDFLFPRYTGLSSNSDVESVVVTMAAISAQAYESAIIKVKPGADIEKMKQEILDNIDMNMWVCVSASRLYVTNYDNVIFLVMGGEDEWTNSVFDAFKAYVGENNIGKVLEKTQNFEEIELPPEILFDPAEGDFEVHDESGEVIENVSGENITNETVSGEDADVAANTASMLPMENQNPVVVE